MLHDASVSSHSDGLVSVSTSLVGVYLSDDELAHIMFLRREGYRVDDGLVPANVTLSTVAVPPSVTANAPNEDGVNTSS